MSELRSLLADTTARVLGSLGGSDFANSWARVNESGLPNVLLPEDKGGFGGSLEDASVVFAAAGAHAVCLPLVECILATRMIADSDLILPDNVLSLAPMARGRLRSGGKFTGEMRSVPYGYECGAIAAILEDRNSSTLIVVERSAAVNVERRLNPAGEPRDHLQFEGANVQASPVKLWTSDRVFRRMALARACQMAGALRAALEIAVTYTRERQQFGKPLASFQAIQQQLAIFAEEMAAAGAASLAAARAADRSEAHFEIAASKLRANQAAATATGIAHQVHGAIGFTAEYGLQKLTRRLWAWRSEFGNDRHWADEIGARVLSRGADTFWSDFVGR